LDQLPVEGPVEPEEVVVDVVDVDEPEEVVDVVEVDEPEEAVDVVEVDDVVLVLPVK
jgi:hypothetical protein